MKTTLALLLLSTGSVVAENVDPVGDGSQYAYSENAGWINAEPLGDGGPGLQVGEFELSGWMWGENLGWISLSCANTTSCGTTDYRVVNDAGTLSGYAWSENAGWVSFSCENTGSCGTSTYGVTIDNTSGEFGGRAWSENLGWITFASNGANPYRVLTSWTCTPPVGSPTLTLEQVGIDTLLSWNALPGTTAYDVVRGDLSTLSSTGGDYSLSTSECTDENLFATSAGHTGNPAPGEGYWFLVRGADCGGGSYDTAGGSQAGPRDLPVGASGVDCM